jgi:hypothetical protein
MVVYWHGMGFLNNSSRVARKNAFIRESPLIFGGFESVLINNKNISA